MKDPNPVRSYLPTIVLWLLVVLILFFAILQRPFSFQGRQRSRSDDFGIRVGRFLQLVEHGEPPLASLTPDLFHLGSEFGILCT